MRIRTMRLAGALLLALLVAAVAPVLSQEIPQVAQGMAVGMSKIDFIDPATGRLNIRIPLLSDTSQRGALNFNYSVVYGGTGAFQLVCNPTCWWIPSSGLPQGPVPIMEGGLGQPAWRSTSTPAYWVDSGGGGTHALAGLTVSTTDGYPWRTTDGSNILVTVPGGWDVINPKGIHFRYRNPDPDSNGYIQDSNGNQITIPSPANSSIDFGPSLFDPTKSWADLLP